MWAEPGSLQELDASSHPFQTGYWAAVKREAGWRGYPFLVGEGRREYGSCDPVPLLVLARQLIPGRAIAYVPFGPPTSLFGRSMSPADFSGLVEILKPLIPEKIAFWRFDPPWDVEVRSSGRCLERLDKAGTPKCRTAVQIPDPVQPDATVIIDLSPDQCDLYRKLRPRAKRQIRVSSGKCTVEILEGEKALRSFSEWYRLYRLTADRDGFLPRSAEYISGLFNPGGRKELPGHSTSQPAAVLLLARIGGAAAAGIIVLLAPQGSLYLFGASDHEASPGCSPSYLLQWHAILLAKAYGSPCYDLYGIPPLDGGIHHHLAGLLIFKTAFGGRRAFRSGTWDVPVSHLFYRAYRLIEKLRTRRARKAEHNPIVKAAYGRIIR